MPDRSPLPLPATQVRMLSDAQLDDIHRATLAILKDTGIRVRSKEALDLLNQAGVQVDSAGTVKIPEKIVEDALALVPSRVDLFSRDGKNRLELMGPDVYFGTGSDLPHTLDLVTSERRPSVLADVRAYARLCDCLENLDFVMSMARASDVPDRTVDRHAFLAMVENTTKPLVVTVKNLESLGDILRLAELVAGDSSRLGATPFVLIDLPSRTPMVLDEGVLEPLLRLADLGLPFVFSPSSTWIDSPAKAPAASMATANAESLCALVIAQLRNPGALVILGATSGSGPYSPWFMQHCFGMTELIRHRYRVPVWSSAGRSASQLPDIQAGIENALWLLWTSLSGANLVHDLGCIESGLAGSFEMVVVGEEIIGLVRDLLRGAKWAPSLFDHHDHQGWIEAGRPNMIRSARETAIEAIGRHVPESLPEPLLVELREIVRRTDQLPGPGE